MSDYSEKYSPPWSPHVRGSYEPRVIDRETMIPEPQRVHAVCDECKAEFRTTCASGMVRAHIATFARVHLHRDPLAPPAASR
jgi:hypothetical protein